MHTRGTGRLHSHRWSAPGLRCFVTCCTAGKRPGLLNVRTAETILSDIRNSDCSCDTDTLAMTVMPDHIHWLFTLGERLSLGRVIARMKSRTGPVLKEQGLAWQRDFFERWLRPGETALSYAFYIFMNPYRDGLIAGAAWPFWWTAHPEQLDFLALLDSNGAPPPEWINRPPAGIDTIPIFPTSS